MVRAGIANRSIIADKSRRQCQPAFGDGLIAFSIRISLHALMAAVLISCSSQGPFREETAGDIPCLLENKDDSGCEKYSLSELQLNIQERPQDLQAYTLGIVEFDDQGKMLKPHQAESIINQIRERGEYHQVSIIVYVHGWYNNAEPGNNDVRKFRGILEALSYTENLRGQAHPEEKRDVIGVYAAWPGRPEVSIIPGLGTLSFPTRKEAAERVAQGEIRTLLALINSTYAEIKKKPNANPRLVIVGHSFGGLIVYAALQQYFINTVIQDDIVKSYGDLVLLINPAFEGVRYDSLNEAVNLRHRMRKKEGKPPFAKEQNPVLVTVASESDDAVRYFFPIGRFLTTIPEQVRSQSSEQYEQILQGVGYIDGLQTHALTYKESPDNRHYAQTPEEKTKEELYECQQRDVFARDYQPNGELQPKWQRNYSQGAVLEHLERDPTDPNWKAPNNPIWMVSVADDVISGHSGIWETEAWLGFLRQLYTDIVSPPPGASKPAFSTTVAQPSSSCDQIVTNNSLK